MEKNKQSVKPSTTKFSPKNKFVYNIWKNVIELSLGDKKELIIP